MVSHIGCKNIKSNFTNEFHEPESHFYKSMKFRNAETIFIWGNLTAIDVAGIGFVSRLPEFAFCKIRYKCE